MSPQNDFILRGSLLDQIPDCSLGEYVISKMRAHPQDKIIQVDADTGAVQTVKELLTESIRLSEGLKNLGLKVNDVVGMMCRNSFEASEIVLGTWLSGAAIAPVPGTMTVDVSGDCGGEFQHILGIIKPKFIFYEEEAVANVTEALNLLSMTPETIFVGNCKKAHNCRTFREVLADVDVDNYDPQPVKSPASQLVAIVSSSGTSGLPKGVGLTHKNIIFQDLNMEALGILDSKMSFLQISQFFWITGIMTFLRCLTKTLKRVLLRNPTELNALKAIEQYKAQLTLTGPGFALSIVNYPDFGKFDVSSMKVLILGGSPFTQNVGEKIMGKWEGISFIQSYGTSEVSGNICLNREMGSYSIGRVTPGVQLKVIDVKTGEPLKANALGELLIKTPGLMKGYVGNEKATREAVDSDNWFHSGDFVYYDESGQIFLVDRLKEMVKIMNMQVSPSEIESVILTIPGVFEVGVTGVTHDGSAYELLAAVVKGKNSTVTEADIHARVANSLSAYKKLTGGVYFVESLPKTPSGKLSRAKLRMMAQTLYSKQ